MRASGKHILLEFEPGNEIVNKGGIFIPHRAIENSKLSNGKIISVGPKCKLGCKEGQNVLFDKYAINKYTDTIGAISEDNIILVEK